MEIIQGRLLGEMECQPDLLMLGIYRILRHVLFTCLWLWLVDIQELKSTRYKRRISVRREGIGERSQSNLPCYLCVGHGVKRNNIFVCSDHCKGRRIPVNVDSSGVFSVEHQFDTSAISSGETEKQCQHPQKEWIEIDNQTNLDIRVTSVKTINNTC